MRNLSIPPAFHLKTLSSFLHRQFPKGYVQKLFKKKGVRINGERGKKDSIIQTGDLLTFYVPPTKPRQAVQNRWTPEILFDNKDFLIINKPPGIAVHEGKTVTHKEALIAQLIHYYKEQKFTPHLVHRLDKDTSGCLLVVKHVSLVPAIEKLFETGQVDKTYITLIKGIIPNKQGSIETPLPGRGGQLVSARSTYKVDTVYRQQGVTLVTVKIETGRMHQIRLHFAGLGYPVVMDDEHGDFQFNKGFYKRYKLKRQFLHASSLCFAYQQKKIAVTAPLPSDLAKTIALLTQ